MKSNFIYLFIWGLVTIMLWNRVKIDEWQEAITWANVDPDLYRHMASLGHNELMQTAKWR